MMIQKNISLKPFNTFQVEANAAFFADIRQQSDIAEALEFAHDNSLPILILGGGSNFLFTKNFPGIVLHINTKGIEYLGEENDKVYLKVQAGTVWEDLIDYAMKEGFYGLENLTLIPGKVGSAPVQNIGAYGIELKDVFHSLEAIDLNSGLNQTFTLAECQFGYRQSIFKSSHKGHYLITSVTFALSKNFHPHLDYTDVKEYFEGQLPIAISPQALREAIRQIRLKKLPEVEKIGSAGSFFKNPVITEDAFQSLLTDFPHLTSFKVPEGIKISAAWLISHCGWKGYRQGDAGVWPQQPLVLVNYGKASGEEILRLANKIIQSVEDRFHIHLESEVNII